MSTIHARRLLPSAAIAAATATIALAVASQLLIAHQPEPAGAARNQAPTVAPSVPPSAPAATPGKQSGTGTTTVALGSASVIDINADPALRNVRQDVAFWTARLASNPRDIVSAQRLAETDIDEARLTGDVTAYLRADAAIGRALAVIPTYAPALDDRAVIDVALHRFVDARDLARQLLTTDPSDLSALGTLADATLELGDVQTARRAIAALVANGDSAAAQVRRSHLAFIDGDAATAVAAARKAVAETADEDLTQERAAWYQFQLGETLASTGDLPGAARAYAAALKADPYSYLARSGLARVAAAGHDWDDAIKDLSEAIEIIPLPDFLARRSDLYQLRAAAGDTPRAAADRATIEAIAQLAGDARNVYDRTLSLYLATHGLDPQRAVTLAENELATRKDVYGYDAAAWALLAAGRAKDADAAMAQSLAFGTRDAKLLYHAGMIKAAIGDTTAARADLEAALALDPSFDPLSVQRAQQTLAALP